MTGPTADTALSPPELPPPPTGDLVSLRSALAVIAAGLSLLLPVLGTLAAVLVVWWANRQPLHGRSRWLVRVAAVITAAVAVVHLVGFLLLMPTSMSVGSDSSSSTSSEVTVTVHFDDDATTREMVAFFDGYNAGSTGTEVSSFSLDPDRRRMIVRYDSEAAAEDFLTFAQSSELVDSLVMLNRPER